MPILGHAAAPARFRPRRCTPLVHRREVDMRELEQVVETVEHEVALLEVVDAVARAHHAFQVEADAVR